MSVNFLMKYLAAAEKAKNYRNKLDGKNACRERKGFALLFLFILHYLLCLFLCRRVLLQIPALHPSFSFLRRAERSDSALLLAPARGIFRLRETRAKVRSLSSDAATIHAGVRVGSLFMPARLWSNRPTDAPPSRRTHARNKKYETA